MKVGLVLGAGGVLGGAWLVGGLAALAEETGWDPKSAEYIVGTSAGSMIGALTASGVPPWFMVAHSAGEVFDGLVGADGQPASSADRSGGGTFRLRKAFPELWPGSLRLGLAAIARPTQYRLPAALAAWVPPGVVSTRPLRETVRRVVPQGWSDHPNLWIIATDYATGRRVAFGREGSPPADLDAAVAASCAVPGFYHPVRIGDRWYVDGGAYSIANLDILRNAGLDLVICLNPLSSVPDEHGNPAGRRAALRKAAGRQLGREARKVREAGTEVVLVQPLGEDLDVMGHNMMTSRGRHRVIEVAQRTVSAQLRVPAVRQALAGLPAGVHERVHRPAGPPSTWPPELLPGHITARTADVTVGTTGGTQ